MTLRETSRRVPARRRRFGAELGFAAAFGTMTSSAWAKSEFPGIVTDTLKLGCVPTCLICHTTPSPVDESTATQPFANSLYAARDARGGGQINEETLGALLLSLKSPAVCPNTADPSCAGGMCTKPCDADGDGMDDIQELEKARNPNNSSTLACPEYGCFARVAPKNPSRPVNGTALLVALGVVGMLVRRGRRKKADATRSSTALPMSTVGSG
jgi:hypothetical protein